MEKLNKKKLKLKKLVKIYNKKIEQIEEELIKIRSRKLKLKLISLITVEIGKHIEEIEYTYYKNKNGFHDEKNCELDEYIIKFDSDENIIIQIGRLYDNNNDNDNSDDGEIFGTINGCSCWDYENNELRFQKKDRGEIFSKVLKGLEIPRTNKNYKKILKICQELIHIKSKILTKDDKLIYIE